MGHQSAIVVLHDSLHEIEANALQFTAGVVSACRQAGCRLKNGSYIDIPIQGYVNAATLFHSAHADVHDVYIVGGNCARKLPTTQPLLYGGYIKPETVNEDVLRGMADALGFRLVKKSKP